MEIPKQANVKLMITCKTDNEKFQEIEINESMRWIDSFSALCVYCGGNTQFHACTYIYIKKINE